MADVKTVNPWNQEIRWIYTYRGIALTLGVLTTATALGCFQADLRHLFYEIRKYNSEIPPPFTSRANCTLLDANCNTTTIVRSTDDVFNFQNRFAIFMIVELILILILWVVVTYSRYEYENSYFSALVRNCKVSKDLETELKNLKCTFLRENPKPPPERPRFVSRDEYGLHKFVSDELVFGDARKFDEARESLEDVMFRNHSDDPTYVFVHVVEWIHDLLKAVKIMHKRNVYHLNLQPMTVYLHWMQSTADTNYQMWLAADADKESSVTYLFKTWFRIQGSGYKNKRHVVLDNLDHAVRSENGQINVHQVGIPRYYRPPECFNLEVIDAAKLDAWCIGVIAYELLTGGQLIVHTSRYPPQSTCEEIVSDTLNKEFVSSALQERHKLFDCFLDIRFKEESFHSYDLDQTVFATDCLTFLKVLLKSDPDQRLSVQQALRHPLMRRVRKEPGKIYYINYPL